MGLAAKLKKVAMPKVHWSAKKMAAKAEANAKLASNKVMKRMEKHAAQVLRKAAAVAAKNREKKQKKVAAKPASIFRGKLSGLSHHTNHKKAKHTSKRMRKA